MDFEKFGYLAIITILILSLQSCGSSNSKLSVDASAPFPGENGEIAVEGMSSTSVRLSWTVASDDTTSVADLTYLVYYSQEDNLSSVDEIEENGTIFGEVASDIDSMEISGLTSNSEYFFNIIVSDATGNKASYQAINFLMTKKYIFVTTEATSGNMGGISGADGFCQSDPAKPNGGLYKAMLVDGELRQACSSNGCLEEGISENIDWILTPNTSYQNIDGELIGTTNEYSIFEFPLENPISDDVTDIWTGIIDQWQSTGAHCTSWSAETGVGGFGESGNISTRMLGVYYTLCSENLQKIYCAEQ